MRAGSFTELGVIMRPGMSIKRRKSADSNEPVTNNNMTGLESGISNLKVSIRRLSINASVGVYEHEIDNPRPLIIDIEVGLAQDYLISHDSLNNTIDYDFLAKSAVDLGKSGHFNLVETFVQKLASALVANEKIKSLYIKIEKPDSVPGALSSCVELNWSRN